MNVVNSLTHTTINNTNIILSTHTQPSPTYQIFRIDTENPFGNYSQCNASIHPILNTKQWERMMKVNEEDVDWVEAGKTTRGLSLE